MASIAANQEREMRVAVERVVGFAQEFGEAHLNLACHAAFPLSLTPDLLYQIWANFVPEAPWTAVARVLLSRLCKQVGYEMYEMDNSVRNLLLRELKVQFRQERFESLGEFLLEYVGQRLTEDAPETQDLREAQKWTVLAYTKPKQAARELAKALRDRVQQEDIGEILRLSFLVETLSEPLVEAGFEPLLTYSKGQILLLIGKEKDAQNLFNQLPHNRDIQGITLPNIPPKPIYEGRSELKLYALLIGIDRYEPNNLYKDLRGCVRDVDLMASYFKNTLQVSSEQIWKLTSSFEETKFLAAIRSAQKEAKPTYANIVQAFREITDKAQSGEQVYIHYSGHGGRAVTIYPELEGNQRQDEGIVPMDIGSSDGRYLRDVEITTLLKRLTDKGCIVTVIFDTCHSGGATRGDFAIRSNYNNLVDTTARSKDSLVASREELLNNWRILTQADTSLSAKWLPNANDYVFLAACRPSDYAFEYAVNGGQRHGALTYWMMDTLISSTSVLTYKSLYNRVKTMIQSKFPQQLPMLNGQGNRLVFGDKRQYKPYTVTVIKVTQDGQEITLDAGLAAGLSSGTRFAIYPVEVNDFSDRTRQIAIAELTDEIQADKSKAIILDAATGGIEVKGEIEPGASAVMVAAPVDLIRKVRLFAEKEAGDKEQDLPADLVVQQTAALEKVRQAIVGNGWIVEVNDGEEGHYQVAVGRDGTYEICIGMPIKNLRPPLSIDDPEAPNKIVERLVHLAKYQSVQALDNPASELTDYLEFHLCDKNKLPFPDPQNVSLQPGEVSYLKIKNTYTKTLNVAVLDLEPTWEISQVPIQGEVSSFFPLDSGQEALTKLRLQLPPDYKQAKETLKIFATKGLANFQWLILPSLDEQPQPKGNLNRGLRDKAEETRTRGGVTTINPLNNLLTAIGSDLDHPPEKTRAMVYEPEPEAEWATQEINITIEV